MGFSSNAVRFNSKKVEEAETFLGPGYYEHRSQFEARSRTAAGSATNTGIPNSTVIFG